MNSCDEDPGGFLFAPDGTVLVLREDVPNGRTSPDAVGSAPRALAASLPLGWEADGPGHAVARNCRGLVVAEYFDQDIARQLRERSRRLVI